MRTRLYLLAHKTVVEVLSTYCRLITVVQMLSTSYQVSFSKFAVKYPHCRKARRHVTLNFTFYCLKNAKICMKLHYETATIFNREQN